MFSLFKWGDLGVILTTVALYSWGYSGFSTKFDVMTRTLVSDKPYTIVCSTFKLIALQTRDGWKMDILCTVWLRIHDTLKVSCLISSVANDECNELCLTSTSSVS